MSLLDPKLPKYAHLTPITAAGLNVTNDSISFLLKYLADNFPDSTVQSIRDLIARSRAGGLAVRFGTTLANGGSEGVPDYTDARYYVDPSSPLAQLAWTDLLETQLYEEIPTSFPGILTATNLAELPPGVLPGITPTLYTNGMGSHAVTPGTRIVLIGYPMQFDSTLVHWVFFHLNATATLQIKSARAVWSTAKAAGRYNATIGVGSVVALDPDSNFRPPDGNMTFPMTPNAIAIDVYEGGAAAAGTCVITALSVVIGTQVGFDNEMPPLPVFVFTSAPSGTAFKVLCNQVSGSQGDATTKASWQYDIFLGDGTGLQLGAALPSQAQRPIGQLNKATEGWAIINPDGTISLAEAIEPPITAPCTPAAGTSGNPAGPSYMGY